MSHPHQKIVRNRLIIVGFTASSSYLGPTCRSDSNFTLSLQYLLIRRPDDKRRGISPFSISPNCFLAVGLFVGVFLSLGNLLVDFDFVLVAIEFPLTGALNY